MTRDSIIDHEGNEVFAREVLPLDPLPADTDYVPGCWSCTGTQRCSGVCSKPPACTFCGRPNDTQTGTCVRCEVVAERGREWDEGAA